MIDIMILIRMYFYDILYNALSELSFMLIPFENGITLADLISSILSLFLFFIVIWVPFAIVFNVVKRLRRL